MSILSALGGTQEPSYANPFLNGSRGGNISGGGLGFPFMPSPDTISKLREFGVNFPEVQQNPLISNATAQAHPLMKLLSGAIMGGALTPGPAPIEGAGQGMSRAMQGILGVPQYKRQFQAAQIQAPFQMADMVAGLRATQGEETLRKQYGDMLEAQGRASTTNAQSKQDLDTLRMQHENDRKEYLQQILDLRTSAQKAGRIAPGDEPFWAAAGYTDYSKSATPEQAVSMIAEKAKYNKSLIDDRSIWLADKQNAREDDKEKRAFLSEETNRHNASLSDMNKPDYARGIATERLGLSPFDLDERTGLPNDPAQRKAVLDVINGNRKVHNKHWNQYRAGFDKLYGGRTGFTDFDQQIHEIYAQHPEMGAEAYGLMAGPQTPAPNASSPKPATKPPTGDPLGLF